MDLKPKPGTFHYPSWSCVIWSPIAHDRSPMSAFHFADQCHSESKSNALIRGIQNNEHVYVFPQSALAETQHPKPVHCDTEICTMPHIRPPVEHTIACIRCALATDLTGEYGCGARVRYATVCDAVHHTFSKMPTRIESLRCVRNQRVVCTNAGDGWRLGGCGYLRGSLLINGYFMMTSGQPVDPQGIG